MKTMGLGFAGIKGGKYQKGKLSNTPMIICLHENIGVT
jgi:hypothetical protein